MSVRSRVGRLLVVLLAAVCVLAGCSRESYADKIAVEGIGQVRQQGLSGLVVRLDVRNDTGHRLKLREASFEFHYVQEWVASLSLREELRVPPHFRGELPSAWRVRASAPGALRALKRKIAAGETGKIFVTAHVRGKGGPMGFKFSREMMPLSEFFNIFGIDIEDLKPYLEENRPC